MPSPDASCGPFSPDGESVVAGRPSSPPLPAVAAAGQRLNGAAAAPSVPPAVAARVPGLQRLPELTLDETARARECYQALLGEHKECITSSFELRVLLGQLGLYPCEAEMELVVKAARQRVNFTALTRYLRFCKREFEVMTASTAPVAPAAGGGRSGNGPHDPRAANAARTAGGSRKSGAPSAAPALGDSDTLLAFVALGGGEDGRGEVSTARLSDVIRTFQLTIDMAGMIDTVDASHRGSLDYEDFCRLWAIPDDYLRRASLGSIAGYMTTPQVSGVVAGSTAAAPAANGQPLSTGGYGQTGASTATPGRGSILASAGTLRNAANSRRKSSMTVVTLTNSGPPQASAVAGRPSQTHGANVKGGAAAAGPASAPLQPLSEEDRLLLLSVLLFPEKHENLISGSNATSRRARLHVPDSAATARLPPLADSQTTQQSQQQPPQQQLQGGEGAGGGSTRGARSSVRRQAWGSTRGASGSKRSDSPQGIFDLQAHGNGVYQPPSPTILFQRSSNSRRVRQDKASSSGKGAPAGAKSTTRTGASAARQGRYGGGAAMAATASGGAAGGGDFADATAERVKTETY